MTVAIADLILDCLYEELVEDALTHLGGGRLLRDRKHPEEPYLTEDGFLVVRVRDQDPVAYARALQRRVGDIRVVKTVDRTPKEN